jgi:hypothetical protein
MIGSKIFFLTSSQELSDGFGEVHGPFIHGKINGKYFQPLAESPSSRPCSVENLNPPLIGMPLHERRPALFR